MDYAKKILNKYGWKDGDGLGKNNDGIAKPLKINLKFDNAGLGVNKAEEFNDNWWQRCFNEASSNVDIIKTNGGDISVTLKNKDDALEISTKDYSVKKFKKAEQNAKISGAKAYSSFVSSTRTQIGDEIAYDNRIAAKYIAVPKAKVITDEELFRVCDGRTAHKGARHGIKLSGKLARLEKQEQQMLVAMQNRTIGSIQNTKEETLRLKKKRDKQAITEASEEAIIKYKQHIEKGTTEEIIVKVNTSTEPLKKKKQKYKRYQ